jgi:hypothetical protein
MGKAAVSATVTLTDAHLQAHFLELLPSIETYGQIYFRHLRCPHKKADAIQEMRALAWKWFIRLTQRGKEVNEFLTTFNTYLAKAVNSGRRLAGMQKAKDVMNPIAQLRHGIKVERLFTSTLASFEQLYSLPHGQETQDVFEERLSDNTVTPVPEQVAFRLDFPMWLKSRTDRDRRVIEDLMLGDRTSDVADRNGLTAGRISQLRQEFHQDWNRFCSDPADDEEGLVV